MSNPHVVIIGAGIVGTSLADELALRGWTDVTVVDRGPLPATGGSSSHAPGLVFATNACETLSGFAQYTIDKLVSLSTPDRLCFNQVGGLEVAATAARMDDLHRKAGWARSWGVSAEVVDADRCAQLHPLLDPSRVLGGLHTPDDGLADAQATVDAQRARATAAGVRFRGDEQVLAIETGGGRVTGVRTARETLPADIVVSCAGFWGVEVGAMVDLAVPLVAMGHQYVTTGAVENMGGYVDERPGKAAAAMPILRHQDSDLYYRQHGDRIGIGYYGHRAMPVAMDELYRDTAGQPMPSMLPFTPEDFDPAWTESTRLLPALAKTHVAEGFNGIFSFTPDGSPLLGAHPGLDGFWIAEAVWVTQSAGVGRTMAEWITTGTPDVDVSGCDIARFSALEVERDHVDVLSARAFDEVYDISHPREQRTVARDRQTSPMHAGHLRRGAQFVTSHGWERPAWFEANDPLASGGRDALGDEWFRRWWSPTVLAEAAATRTAMGLYDMTSLMRVEVTGADAARFLAPLLTRDPDRPIGTVLYALILDDTGGIRSDVTVARTAADRFQIGVNGPVDIAWLTAHARRARAGGMSVSVRETTTETSCLGVWGPRAESVIAPLTTTAVDATSLPFYRCAPATVAGVEVLLMRVSYVGEFGWEIYADAADGAELADRITEAAQPVGAVWAGRGALDCLRIEKGFRSWGTDMSAVDSPDEAGLAFAVAKNHEFVGRAAMLERPVRRRLHTVIADDPATVLMGSEPVSTADGPVGHITSAAFSPTIGRTIAYAWGPADLRTGDQVGVDWFDTTASFTVSPTTTVDPENARIKGRY
ncbi:GcvT family protein [Williamsia maris]|uniref:Glycine cleavage system T protein (Aminomethyltransferase) n=1 Tax=Williamsia maris TaxID=72806 RepID=A0ABT1HKQ5_9NOCA|nr:FAD-dependent oxidoreductase [Williamsia maris]MCP2178524.1 Glycine cleavage system T protein (aminomethyltransferase) [Williamsia maris]